MPNYRRATTPGATWFFTVNLLEREGNDLLVREIATLRRCFAKERAARPFTINAWVVLPEHMHWIWTLPVGDSDFATRWRRIRVDFSKRQRRIEQTPQRQLRDGERGVWQRRYWEHQIRDDVDYRRHFDYIHYNPVKHGHVQRTADWPGSSFRHYVDRGVYSEDWADAVSVEIPGDD